MLEALAVSLSKSSPGKFNFTFVGFAFRDFDFSRNLKQHQNPLINSHVCESWNWTLTELAAENRHLEFAVNVSTLYYNCLWNVPKPDLILAEALFFAPFDFAYENHIPIIAEQIMPSDFQVSTRSLCRSHQPAFFQFVYAFSGKTWNPLLLYVSQLFCRNVFSASFLQFLTFGRSMRSNYDQSKSTIDWSTQPNSYVIKERSPHFYLSHAGIIEYNGYLPHNHFLVGPIILSQQSNSDETIQLFLDKNSKSRIVLFSMGTAWSLPDDRIRGLFEILLDIMHSKSISVMFRSNARLESNLSEILVKQSQEIQDRVYLTSKTIPQKFLLSQENMGLFISHGGYSSVMESLYFGVPLLVAPINADQFAMCQRIQDFGYGRCTDGVSLARIAIMIKDVLENPKFINRASKASLILKNSRPAKEIEKLIDTGLLLGSFDHYLEPFESSWMSLFIDHTVILVEIGIVVLFSLVFWKVLNCCIPCRSKFKTE